MMNLAEEVIKVTLKSIQDSPIIWLDQSKGVLSRLLNKESVLRKNIRLQTDEEPLFEYASLDSYSLITTKRVISDRDNKKLEIEIENIFRVKLPKRVKVVSDLENIPPSRLLIISDNNGNELCLEFDPYYPHYFARILINNLSSKLRTNSWYLNPSTKK